MSRKTKICILSFICLWVAFAFGTHIEAAYPEKPIEMLIHASPGGGSDLFCRAIAQIMEKENIVQQKIQVASRRGGGGTQALNYLASKRGDPYVIMQVTTSPIVTLGIRKSSKMTFDDPTYLALLAEFPQLVFVRYDSPYKDLKALVAAAKKSPKSVSAAMSTTGGSEHIVAHRIGKAAGVEFNIISFGSGGKAAAALLGGHVDFTVGNIEEQLGQVDAKKIRPIATVTEKRIPYYPDVPTAKEQGVDVVYTQVRGFIAPQDFPDEATKFWEDAFAKLVNTQGFKDYMRTTFGVEAYLKGDAFKTFLKNYISAFNQDVEELGLFKKKK